MQVTIYVLFFKRFWNWGEFFDFDEWKVKNESKKKMKIFIDINLHALLFSVETK